MSDPRRPRLESWKEIASYLGRDVRTAIRWEHERGLPVHRVPGGKRGAVFAFRDEVDRWLDNAHRDGDATARVGVADGRSGAGGLVGTDDGRRPPGALTFGHGRIGLVLGGAGVFAVAAVLAGAWSLGRPAAARPASAAFEGRRLVAMDADGTKLWSDELRSPLAEDAHVAARYTRVADLDGDGRAEVLAAVPFRQLPSFVPNELRCYSADGQLRWRTQIEDEVRFRGGRFGPPWRGDAGLPIGSAVEVYRVGGRTRIAWAQNHHTWWPSVLSVFDADGRRVARFVHAGVLYTIATTEHAGKPLLLAGGVSNSREAAFVAVLDGSNPSGSGPEAPGSPYECLDCPPGRPVRYFTITPSEMAAAAGHPYNTISRLSVLPDGLEIWTSELGNDVAFSGVVRLSPDLLLQHASWDSAYDLRHRELEKAGRLDHALADCPERGRPPRVREWTPEGGWHELTPEDAALAVARPE